MNKNEIIDKLKKILHDKINYSINEENFYAHLLSKEIGLRPRDLLSIYFIIEKYFEITIPEQCIIDGAFSSFNNIVNIIQNETSIRSQRNI